MYNKNNKLNNASLQRLVESVIRHVFIINNYAINKDDLRQEAHIAIHQYLIKNEKEIEDLESREINGLIKNIKHRLYENVNNCASIMINGKNYLYKVDMMCDTDNIASTIENKSDVNEMYRREHFLKWYLLNSDEILTKKQKGVMEEYVKQEMHFKNTANALGITTAMLSKYIKTIHDRLQGKYNAEVSTIFNERAVNKIEGLIKLINQSRHDTSAINAYVEALYEEPFMQHLLFHEDYMGLFNYDGFMYEDEVGDLFHHAIVYKRRIKNHLKTRDQGRCDLRSNNFVIDKGINKDSQLLFVNSYGVVFEKKIA